MTASIDTASYPVTAGSVKSGLETAEINLHLLPSTLIVTDEGGT